ncbi:acetylglutamate kinase [Dinghuibacter silviterrae]|uniref:Acetylglutamate kinase n=1 Tax=Dinghuibacter silviterrae TaxID=1539049 RepID=A0A4R8DPM4_9BACT|nr:acetylglutamate kinase [Dinghuibacter silviterrae]TDW99667.1 N-acetylglutamate kinase [Dinghuibacter silviterrae]
MTQLFVIKIGGNVIDHPQALDAFLEDFAGIPGPRILVHGGGKIATRLGEQLGIVSQYVQGRRITDDATIDLVTMVYGGLVNKQVVAALQAKGCNAIGLTGADAGCIPADKRPVKTIDYGWVGDIDPGKVNTGALGALLDAGLVPVMAPLTHDGKGHMLNTNADTIASALAVALSGSYAVRLIYCFEKKGVLEDLQNEDSVIPLINRENHARLLAEGKLADGIIPKIDNAFAAIDAGVKEVLIGDAADLRVNVTGAVSGTLIVS